MPRQVANVSAQDAFVEAHSTWAADLVHLPHIGAQIRRWLGLLGLDQGTPSGTILIMQQMVESMSIHKNPDGTRVLLRHPITR
ncbi:MAG: hypothetical protein QOI16_3825 [Pseudonocardiales bacterium]|jgi:hypothetical protein|nr:hypothetical protein [Pseudonocardiales bacterium]